MNQIDRDLRRSVGITPERTLHRIVHKPGHLVTEGQIETAGKAYVKAGVWTMLAAALIDGMRLVGRTVWKLATLTAVIAAGVWAFNHWHAIIRWL